jgi:hypothetical protein
MRFAFVVLFGLLPSLALAQAPPPPHGPAIPEHPATLSVQCGGVNDSQAIQAAVAAMAARTSSRYLAVHGACVMPQPITQTVSDAIAIVGDGPGITTFTFPNATDGFRFMLKYTPATKLWGSVRMSGLSVIRQPGDPAQANTGISIVADPTVGVGYYGLGGLSDVSVGGNGQASSWATGIDLQSVSNFELRNVNVLGPNATGGGTDTGVAISGSGPSMFAVQIDFTDCNIQGFSTGVGISKYVQGVSMNNVAIIGDWWGINWQGASPPTTYRAASTTPAGSPIVVSPANAALLSNDMIVNGPGIEPQSRIAAINKSTGQITLRPAPTGSVASGASVAFQVYYVAEGLNVVNGSFNATYRDIQDDWGSFVQVSNSTFLQYGTSAPNWSAIDLEEANNNTINGNSILGHFTGTENGIIISSISGQGKAPNAVMGNIVNGVTSAGIHLGGVGGSLASGTVSNTTVVGNVIYAARTAVASNVPNMNQILANGFNGLVSNFSADTSKSVQYQNFRKSQFEGHTIHVQPMGTPTTVSNCGTGATVTGNDQGGEISVGAGAVNGCELVFGLAWDTAPFCTAITDNASIGATFNKRDVKGFVWHFPASLAGGHLIYNCQG